MFEGLFQPMHLLVLLFIAMLVFGPKRLGDIGKGLGDAIRGFKEALREEPTKPAVGSEESKTQTTPQKG